METWTDLEKFLAMRAQKKSQKLVFTNGCFDLLHAGHVQYLQQARMLGDMLVVGLNSDSSVRELKGPKRPIHVEQDRQALLCALACVNGVFLFCEPTPLALITRLEPDVLVKGGDWAPEQIVGADLVLARGGEVHSLPFLPGYSSTGVIEKILRRYGRPSEGEGIEMQATK